MKTSLKLFTVLSMILIMACGGKEEKKNEPFTLKKPTEKTDAKTTTTKAVMTKTPPTWGFT